MSVSPQGVFTPRRKWTHLEYVQHLEQREIPIYLKEGEQFRNLTTKIVHICPFCQEDWLVEPRKILSNRSTKCVRCSTAQVESVMATVVKQVLRHYYPKTQYEVDFGFRSRKGYPCFYDVYVPERQHLVIEFQSEFHDRPEQQIRDQEKKDYILSLGYQYLAIDCRDYTPLQALQLFFPHLQEIPSFVSIQKSSSRTWSLEKAQMLLNEKRYTYREIAELVGDSCTEYAIKKAIHKGQLIRPATHPRRITGTPTIYQFSLNEEFVACHYSTNIQGFDKKTIPKACRGTYHDSHQYKGYLWYYETNLPESLQAQIQVKTA